MVVSAFILSHEQELNNSGRPDKLTLAYNGRISINGGVLQ